jgi:hypothetical protein
MLPCSERCTLLCTAHNLIMILHQSSTPENDKYKYDFSLYFSLLFSGSQPLPLQFKTRLSISEDYLKNWDRPTREPAIEHGHWSYPASLLLHPILAKISAMHVGHLYQCLWHSNALTRYGILCILLVPTSVNISSNS